MNTKIYKYTDRYILWLKILKIFCSKIFLFILTLSIFLLINFLFGKNNINTYLIFMLVHIVFYSIYIKLTYHEIKPIIKTLNDAICILKKIKENKKNHSH